MLSLNDNLHFSKRQFQFNFQGGKLSTDGGLLLFHTLIKAFQVDYLTAQLFSNRHLPKQQHTFSSVLLQLFYQLAAGYKTADVADELAADPALTLFLDKQRLASQPTLSRFINSLGDESLVKLKRLDHAIRKRAYLVSPPEFTILDLDSTLINTYGEQEGSKFNYHYQQVGLHPLVCFEAFTGDLLAAELRPGAAYSCNGAVSFMQPILDKMQQMKKMPTMILRGDSGFADNKIYTQCETNGCYYAIRLKENNILKQHASHLLAEVNRLASTATGSVALYDDFYYQAGSWAYPRRVVCKVEKKQGELFAEHTFVVTNMDQPAKRLIKLYCKRGLMENYIKEFKNSFCMSMSNRQMKINQNLLLICQIAYNLFNWMKRLTLDAKMGKGQADGIRLRLLKVAGKVVRHGRRTWLELCSCFPYRRQLEEALRKVDLLAHGLALLL